MTRPLIFDLLKAPAAVLGVSLSEKAVLQCYVDELRPESNGTLVWPSQETIGERIGADARTVRRAVAGLVALDLIKLHRRTGKQNVYSVNVGLIHRLIETGQNDRSENRDRSKCPVRPDKLTGQTGQIVRQSTEEPPTNPHRISTVGGSSALKARREDPQQRRLAIFQTVEAAADRMRADRGEAPTIEKNPETPALAIGALAPRERPG